MDRGAKLALLEELEEICWEGVKTASEKDKKEDLWGRVNLELIERCQNIRRGLDYGYDQLNPVVAQVDPGLEKE